MDHLSYFTGKARQVWGRVAVVWMANVLPDPPVDCMGVVKYLADDWIGLRLGPLGRGFSRHLQSPSS